MKYSGVHKKEMIICIIVLPIHILSTPNACYFAIICMEIRI